VSQPVPAAQQMHRKLLFDKEDGRQH